MGYTRHHAIVVTDFDKDRINQCRDVAVGIFGDQVSSIIESPVNGWMSFFIAPDGSKEGWEDSDIGDTRRDEFKVAMRSTYPRVRWAEIQYGDDSGRSIIVDHSDADVKLESKT